MNDKNLLKVFHPDVVVVDESGYARDDQVLNSIVFFPSVELFVLANLL